MLAGCAECTRLWHIYHAATVEEIRAYQKLAGAKLKTRNPELIAALLAHANTLSLLVTASSIQVAEHRAIHGPARQPSLQSGIGQSVVPSSMPPHCPECVRLWDIYYAVSVDELIDQHASTSVKVVRGSMSLHIRVVSNLFWPQLRFFNEFGPVLSWLRRCIKFTEANQEPSHEMHTGESSRAFLESTHITSPNSSTKKRRPGHVAL